MQPGNRHSLLAQSWKTAEPTEKAKRGDFDGYEKESYKIDNDWEQWRILREIFA